MNVGTSILEGSKPNICNSAMAGAGTLDADKRGAVADAGVVVMIVRGGPCAAGLLAKGMDRAEAVYAPPWPDVPAAPPMAPTAPMVPPPPKPLNPGPPKPEMPPRYAGAPGAKPPYKSPGIACPVGEAVSKSLWGSEGSSEGKDGLVPKGKGRSWPVGMGFKCDVDAVSARRVSSSRK